MNGLAACDAARRSSLMGSRQPTLDLTRGVFARLGSPRLYFLEFRCQSKIVTCPSDTHLHFLSNSHLEIALCVFRCGLPSIKRFKSPDEPMNALCIFLHFDRATAFYTNENIILPISTTRQSQSRSACCQRHPSRRNRFRLH